MPAGDRRPNIVFIMSDDHAAHAVSAYGSRINTTPGIDRIADGGIRLDAAFCTNSICTPSRASILTGTYNHVNGVTTLDTPLDNSLVTFPKLLQSAGYQTAMIGKWHLGHGPRHDPVGFDHWRVLPGQGHYHDPVMLAAGGEVIERGGYVTDLITDDCIDWLDRRDRDRPFLLLCHHKAPHRRWEPARRHAMLFDDIDLPEPETMFDDLLGRHVDRAAVVQAMRMRLMDLDPIYDLKAPVPDGLDAESELRWRYQRYMKDYLRTIAAVDEGVDRVLDYLDADGIADDTIVVYTSDQGFFLGDHGWFDKRLMYEESLRMPFLVRYPRRVAAGSTSASMVLNVDVAPTLLEWAGVTVPTEMQGHSAVPVLEGHAPDDWRTSMYYRYWMHRDGAHNVPAHLGVRTATEKLICYYNDPCDQLGAHGPVDPVEWEYFDLVADPLETTNCFDDPAAAQRVEALRSELARLIIEVGDTVPSTVFG
jgi:arylsulfatase A-like enzyme